MKLIIRQQKNTFIEPETIEELRRFLENKKRRSPNTPLDISVWLLFAKNTHKYDLKLVPGAILQILPLFRDIEMADVLLSRKYCFVER